jgi:hypothetical protein
MIGDEGQRAINSLGFEKVDHALPDEQGFVLFVIPATLQDLTGLLGI